MPATNTATDPLWRNNIALVQLLGLCPLLAVTTTTIKGLGLGLATCFVMISSNVLVSVFRRVIPIATRIAVFVVIIAALVTIVELVMNAYFHELSQVLGIFVPLIVCNCVILGRAEAFAYKNPLLPSLVDGIMTGLGFAIVLIALGGARELIGSGSLLADAEMLFGPGAENLQINLLNENGFRLALIPPGAFISLGLTVALQRYIEARRLEKRRAMLANPAA